MRWYFLCSVLCAFAGAGMMLPVKKTWTGLVAGLFLGPVGLATCWVIRFEDPRDGAEAGELRACPICGERTQVNTGTCGGCEREQAA